MIINYYGTRGSLPTPGASTIKYGGNTTCLAITCGTQKLIVDGGSGLRLLGNNLMKTEFGKGKGQATFFWTHFHWDHLMGFPFFVPNYIPGNQFHHYGSKDVEKMLRRQQEFKNFPVTFDQMPAKHTFNTIKVGQVVNVGSVKVSSCTMNHPGKGFTYRFDYQGKSVVFATDVEHQENGIDAELLKLSQGADLLIYDAQYTPQEYLNGHQHWGHSTYVKGIELAKAANVRHLHLFHHDQLHADKFLETKILAPAKKRFQATALAKEGWSIKL